MGSTAFRPGGPAGLLGSLALLLIDLPVFIKIELGKHFGKLAITEGPLSIGTGSRNAESGCAE